MNFPYLQMAPRAQGVKEVLAEVLEEDFGPWLKTFQAEAFAGLGVDLAGR